VAPDHGNRSTAVRHRRPREGWAARDPAEPDPARPRRKPSSRASTSTRCTRRSSGRGSARTTHAVLGKAYSPLGLFTSEPGTAAGTKPPAASTAGYWLAGPTGHVHGFGGAIKFGSIAHVAQAARERGAHRDPQGALAGRLRRPRVYSFGDSRVPRLGRRDAPQQADRRDGRKHRRARATGSARATAASSRTATRASTARPATLRLNKPIVAMAATQDGQGLLALRERRRHLRVRRRALLRLDRRAPPEQADRRDGVEQVREGLLALRERRRHLNYGDAAFHGSKVHTTAPVCGFAPFGQAARGYWIAASDGTVGAFGDAPSFTKVADFTVGTRGLTESALLLVVGGHGW